MFASHREREVFDTVARHVRPPHPHAITFIPYTIHFYPQYATNVLQNPFNGRPGLNVMFTQNSPTCKTYTDTVTSSK